MSAVNPLSIGRIMSADLSSVEKNQTAAEDFESYLVEMLLKEMRKTIPKGMFSSPAMDTFTEMMDKALAQDIAESGGLGFAEAMFAQMGMDTEASDGQNEKDNLREFNSSRRKIGNIGSKVEQHVHGLFEHLQQAKDNVIKLVGELPVKGRISSHFGMRHHPIHEEFRHHSGLDIAAPKGSPIEAVMDGKVIFAGKRGNFGNTVIIEHEDGYKSLYAHCDQLNVSVGDKIQTGEQIATVGSTGLSTGNHLHFEIRKNEEAIDPLQVFSWSDDD